MGGKWNSDSRIGNRWIVFGLLGGTCLCGGAIVMPLLANKHPGAPRTVCLSNLRQLGTAIAIYEQDFDARFPLSDWQPAIKDYTKNDDLLKCTAVKHDGYAMNYSCIGMKEPKQPIPLLFETDALGKSVVMNLAGRNRDRHKGQSNVAYTDMSARSVNSNEEP